MAQVFCSAFSGKSKVYEVALDAGNVVVTIPAPADLTPVDRIQLLDPVSLDEFNFSIFSGTLKSKDPLWQNLQFQTRCFLTPAGIDNLAPITLQLTLTGGQIVVSEFEMFGERPFGGLPSGTSIAALSGFRFFPGFRDLGVSSFAPPEVLRKLGFFIDSYSSPPPGFQQPQLGCYPQKAGVQFKVYLPLDSNHATQSVAPYNITFASNDPALQNVGGTWRGVAFSQSSVPATDTSPGSWTLGIELPPAIVLSNWNDVMAFPFLTSLNMVRGGLPASFLPSLVPAAGQTTSFNATLSLVDSVPPLKAVSSANCVFRDPESDPDPAYVNLVTGTVQVAAGQTVNCIATFLNLKRQDGQPLQAACILGPLSDLGAATEVAGYCFGFQHQFDPYSWPPPGSQPALRMGALNLSFPPAPTSKAPASLGTGQVRASLRVYRSGLDDLPGPLVRIDYLSIQLAVSALAAGGQDQVPGAEYAPPNQPYPRGAATSTQRAPALQIPRQDIYPIGDYFILDVTETCYELTSQTLALGIEQQRPSLSATGAPANNGLQIVVIDPEPFFISQVSLPDYQQALLDAVTDQIFSWNNYATDASWQISASTPSFQLTLPPQGVTEAMHKSKDQQPPDITPGVPIDFRFTPPAVLDLQTSVLPTRFVEVPWNLRRVLGYPQQSAPGALLDAATFELIYGLSTTLNAKPGLMIAEIGARLGQLPAAPNDTISWQHSASQEQAYEKYTGYWTQLNPLLRTRLAALEPWSAAQPSGLTLTQDDNLSFQLRKGADLAYPIPLLSRANGVPSNIPDGALEGSFSWAFDSERIYQSLWANPNSVSGEISGLAFSSLGGWGQFTARFANGKTSIIASVRMGRIQTLTIEQIGRIGNFWNRAKLVITYERTVAASRQFYQQQEPFYGNPILRKTAEYVQLLEKSRSAAATDTVGPYSACDFPNGDPPKIPVDSAWGRDVGTYGYKIPLWKPGAQPSDVYVKPAVRLHLKGALSDDTVPHFIADPEKLCFYTTTDPNLNADTDKWPKALSVDYGYVSADWVGPTKSSTLTKSVANAKGKVGNFITDITADDETWIRPGLGAFTYSLESPPLPSNLTAGVSATAIGTTVRTITIMRGADQSAMLADPATDFAKSLMIPDYVTNILRPVVSQLRAGAGAGDLTATWNNLKAQVRQNAGTCFGALTGLTLPASPANQLQSQLKAQLSTLSTQVENGTGALLTEAFNLLAPSPIPADPAAFATMKQNWAPAAGAAGDGTTLYEVIQAQLSFTGTQITTWTHGLSDKIHAAISPDPTVGIIPVLNNLVGSLPGEADRIGLVQKTALQIDTTLAQTVSAVESALMPLAGGNMDQLRQSLIAVRGTIAAAAQSATGFLQEAPPDITSALGVLTPLAKTCQGTQQTLDSFVKNLETSAAAFQKTTVEKTLSLLDSQLSQAPDWNTFVANAKAPLAAISTGIQNTLNSQMNDLSGQIADYANLAGPILQNTLTDTRDSIAKLLNPDAIEQFFDNLTTGIGTVADAANSVEDYLHGLESATGQFMDAIRPQLPSLPQLPAAGVDTAMFLLRGFGDVPAVPQLNFNQPFSAFRFAGLDSSGLPFQLPQVNLTPLVGLANQLGQDIGNPINLAIPAFQLADNLIPFNLSSFDFGSLIPNIAGMDLSNLFQGLRLPDSMGKNVVVTHGEDLQSRSAWVEIDVNINLADDAEVFSYFGVTLTLETANFQANTHLQGQAGQPVTRTMKGSVTGDWSLAVGGFEVVVLEDCSLTFDESGHFGFNVTPNKVKLQAVLEFLSDLIADFFDGDGFTISITPEGVQTVLELPLPDIQSGTFGIANLSLMCSFGLVFSPNFTIQAGLGLAGPDNPFTLTVFILGGAGYLELDAAYTPSTNIISTSLEIGIFASASLAISLGPISGGVYVYFGITVSYHAQTGQAADLQIGLELMFIGQVSLLGFISVSLVLSLSAVYDSTSHILIGTGTVQFTIKISFFFTLNVSSSVSYTFSNHPVAAPLSSAGYEAAAAEYLAMFSN